MYLLGGGLAFGVILGAAAFVSVKGPSIASPIYGTEVEPKTLTLTKTSLGLDKLDNPLPDKDHPSSTPQEFVLNEFETIKTRRATKNDDMVARLNRASGGASYLEKVEPCYGMTSIYIDLNYGYVDILTGYEPGVWTNRYSVKQYDPDHPELAADVNDKLQKTITVVGNYFRIENIHTSENALIKEFRVDYACGKESQRLSPSYTMQNGPDQGTVRGNPGHWFYHQNSGWAVQSSPKPEFAHDSFTSTITAVSDVEGKKQGVWYRYQPVTSGELTNAYKVSLEARLSVAGRISGVDGDNVKPAAASTWTSFTSSERTFDGSTQPFYLRVNGIAELPAEGYVTVEVRNICIHRTLA